MADYISQFTGGEIDRRLAKVSDLEAGKQDKLESGENIKTVGGQSLLGAGNIPLTDQEAVKFTPQTLTDEQKAQALANIGAASYEEVANMDFVTVTTLPEASADTMGHIYLVGPDANNNYDRYVTKRDGSTYTWEPLGSTQIDLSGYATKAEVTQLQDKVDEATREKSEQTDTYDSAILIEEVYIKRGTPYTEVDGGGDYFATDFISLEGVTAVHAKCGSSSSSGNVVAVSFYTGQDLATAMDAYSLFYTGQSINQDVQIPSGANYLRLCNGKPINYPFELKLTREAYGNTIKSADLKEQIDTNTQNISDNAEAIDALEETVSGLEETTAEILADVTVPTYEDVTLDSTALSITNFIRVQTPYINRDGLTNYCSTDYISTEGVKDLHIKCNLANTVSTIVAIAFFTQKDSLENDAELPHIMNSGMRIYDTAASYDIDVSIPEGAKYFRVCNSALTAYKNNFLVTFKRKSGRESRLNPMESAIQEIETEVASVKSPLAGKNVLLIGASFAFSANGWFEYAAEKLGFTGVNRGRSGSYMYDVAINFNNPDVPWTYLTDERIAACDVLVIMYTHNLDCYNGADLEEDYTDYVPSSSMSDAAAYDCVIKHFLARRLELGVKTLPKIVLCTHWHDGRTIFNDSVRQLAKKWGFPLVCFDENISASGRLNHPTLVDVNDNALSPTIFHALNPIADYNTFPDAGHSYKGSVECDMLSPDGSTYRYDAETINGIICAWHPDRRTKKTLESPDESIDTGVYPQIQQLLGTIFCEKLKEVLE